MQRLLNLSTGLLAFLALAPFLAYGHSAIEPAPRRDQWWDDRHKLINRRAAEAGEKAQVIFIGDSITHGWEGEGKDVWAKYYAHRNALNLGISGDRTQHVLWRFENGNLEGIKPKAAVIMIGTNNSNGEDNTPGQIVDGVTAIVKKLREKLPDTKVVLLAIFPRSENFSAQRGKILQVNQVLRKLADQRDIFWVDFGHRFVDEEGLIPASLMPDYLHLTKRGYEIWAESIERRLASIIGDEPVRAESVNLSGDWIAEVQMGDRKYEIPFVLQAQGGRVTGKFTGEDGTLAEIADGRIRGDEVSWNVRRQRDDGSTMVYRMSGTVQNGTMRGIARTEYEGQERSAEWTARRK